MGSLLRQLLVLGIVAALLWVGHPFLLSRLGGLLVRAEAPAPADAILVLAGDEYGNRVLKGGELVRQGFAPVAYVSSPKRFYGHREADFAIPFAVARGFPASSFVALPTDARSTREEAESLLPELRRAKVRRLLVVTSDYHTRRSSGIYRALARDMQVRVVAAPDANFRPDDWWKRREGWKTVFYESVKVVTGWFGI